MRAYGSVALPPPSAHKHRPAPGAIRADGLVPAGREEVFAFLADLENHWLITDRFVRVVSLDGNAGARTGGQVRIRGPLGLGRTARIRLEAARPPDELVGSVRIGDRTRAEVRWALEDLGDGTSVALASRLLTASPVDRALWAAGGRGGMRRRLQRAVRGLAARFS